MAKEILVNSASRETRIATLDEKSLVELRVEREEQVVGNIYKARVENVLPGMDAAFLDIGLERNAFLYVADILPEPSESEPEEAETLPSAIMALESDDSLGKSEAQESDLAFEDEDEPLSSLGSDEGDSDEVAYDPPVASEAMLADAAALETLGRDPAEEPAALTVQQGTQKGKTDRKPQRRPMRGRGQRRNVPIRNWSRAARN